MGPEQASIEQVGANSRAVEYANLASDHSEKLAEVIPLDIARRTTAEHREQSALVHQIAAAKLILKQELHAQGISFDVENTKDLAAFRIERLPFSGEVIMRISRALDDYDAAVDAWQSANQRGDNSVA